MTATCGAASGLLIRTRSNLYFEVYLKQFDSYSVKFSNNFTLLMMTEVKTKMKSVVNILFYKKNVL